MTRHAQWTLALVITGAFAAAPLAATAQSVPRSGTSTDVQPGGRTGEPSAQPDRSAAQEGAGRSRETTAPGGAQDRDTGMQATPAPTQPAAPGVAPHKPPQNPGGKLRAR